MISRNSLFSINNLNRNATNINFISECYNYINILNNKNLPVIFDLQHLAIINNISHGFLSKVIYRAIIPYRFFNIKKKSGGKRRITIPNQDLIKLHEYIHKNILDNIPTHPCATAYKKGISTIDNSKCHCNYKVLIKLDIENFFESISERKVYYAFLNQGYTKYVSFCLSRLCTFPILLFRKNKSLKWRHEFINSITRNEYKHLVGSLLQGTKVSPQLSNICFKNIDEKIIKICSSYKCSITRYSDDITISSNNIDRNTALTIIKKIQNILNKEGFRLNKKKTRILFPGSKKVVTGLIVNTEKPTVQKSTLTKVKNYIYYINKFGIENACLFSGFKSINGFKNHIYGNIIYIKSINDIKGNMYLSLYNKITWPKI